MSNEQKQQQPQQQQPRKSQPIDTEGAVRVAKLSFRDSIDVPGEQGVRYLTTQERQGKPKYEMLWLPRCGRFLVRASVRKRFAGPWERTPEFTLPDEWAIAEHEAL